MHRIVKRKKPAEALLTSTQVAELLGVTRMTVSRYAREGVLPGPKRNRQGGYGYWTNSDVEVARRILEARRSDAA